MKHTIHSFYKSGAEWLMPVRTDSAFLEYGVLTPAEFVAAADHLVNACPTWQWGKAKANLVVNYLPKHKQYLMTKNVPCHERAEVRESEVTNDDYSIIDCHSSVAHFSDEVMDLKDLENDDDVISSTRTYDLMITYDKYYQVPRCWLVGYDTDRRPLSPEQIMQDMSVQHAQKTITIDPFPYNGILCASIHPCRHAKVLHKLIRSSPEKIRVDDALIIFLKFLSSVIPTIQYDFTMATAC